MPRILLVDDSALIRNSMQAALEPHGVELVHAENGKVAIEKVSIGTFDLIFLDVVMPVMDGPAALREIRARGITTPVVLVTSVSTAAIVGAALKLGDVHYIGKPFTPAQIVSVATKLLRLDPTAPSSPPRVLVQHSDPDFPRRLAKVLPPHVAIDATTSLGESLDRAELGQELVLFEAGDDLDEMEALAKVFREALPAAAIFAISPIGVATTPWEPRGALDGVLPPVIDSTLGRGFLYATCLRPLVRIDGRVARAAGFHGAPAYRAAYVASLTRTLLRRCGRLDMSRDLHLDLRRVNLDPDALVALVDKVNEAIKEAGGAPAFRLPEVAARESRLASILTYATPAPL